MCGCAVHRTPAQQAGMLPWHWPRHKRRGYRNITVVLAKQKMAPLWWFLREPKHVGVNVGILIVLIFLWFYNCVHRCGIIKKCFDTVDARYKHEDEVILLAVLTCVYSTKLVKCVHNWDVFCFSVAVCLFYLQICCKYFDIISCHCSQ
jgi:hypothetical protein